MTPTRPFTIAPVFWLLQMRVYASTLVDDCPALCRAALEDGRGLMLLQAQSIPVFDTHRAGPDAAFPNHTTDDNRSLSSVQRQRQHADNLESRVDTVLGLSTSSRQAVEFGLRLGRHGRNSSCVARVFWSVIGLTFLVLYMTGDNAVWLFLFVGGNCTGSRHSIASLYVACMGLAWLLAYGLYRLVPADGLAHWGIPPQCIAEFLSSCCLVVLSFRFFQDRYAHAIVVDGPITAEEKVVAVFEEQGFDYGHPFDQLKEDMMVQGVGRLRRTELTLPNMFWLAAASNIDTVGILVRIMLSKRFQPYEVCLGCLMAASIVAGAVVWASCNQRLRETTLRLPLWVMVAFFTAIVIVDTTVSVSCELAQPIRAL